MKIINRTVLILSVVSMFADVASEMLYPVIPVYLREIGFSVFAIGALEGVAGFTAGLTKGYFGKWSDELGRRLPFIRSGYFLSALSKPMMGFFTLPLWVFFVRCTDRLGKGLRTAPRDALLAENATETTRARVFGFHRSLDTLGAAIGPCLALALLWRWPGHYHTLFWAAFVPGLLSVVLLFTLREQQRSRSTLRKGGFFSFFRYWKIARPEYKQLVPALLLFALFNSSDVFLLLKTREVSGSDTTTITAYIFYNMVFAGASYPLGVLADRFGKRMVLVSGLLVFAIVYSLFAFVQQSVSLIFLGFLLYGLYAAATEGIAKAWIASLAPTDTGTALGFYSSGESIAALLASLLTGFLWTQLGAFSAFGVTVLATLLVVVYLLIIKAK
ncbi:MFS transporter [Flaviaesturariibacter aridisoli]|uniref:MFS transporter n=1 Tax=Flaviaesturariibacter aridisoli TaxID=2545761 RepID=A0A4R4DVF3_9BACT|nr:MFS transporter [Flaviaesturariibacter aridisoli]TCZ67213.1 MFS transporter [Flaviaesturariibacter aridisoli]